MEKIITYKGVEIKVFDDGKIVWNGKERKHYFNHDEYPVVSIMAEAGWRSIGVHRLIALAFIPNPNNYTEVDHINFDRKDYSISNLAWISHADNVKRSTINYPDRSGKNNSNYGNRKLSQFYKENPDEAKKKQSRPGKQNGRYKTGKYMSVNV